MTNIAERLHRVAQELTAIQAEISARARGQSPDIGPRAQQALEVLRAYIAKQGGSAPWCDCAYHLITAHGYGRSAAYEHVKRLHGRGRLISDARRVQLSLPGADSLI